jgi:hypothetical protein
MQTAKTLIAIKSNSSGKENKMYVGYTTLSGLLQELTTKDLIYIGLIEEGQSSQVGSWIIEAVVSSPFFHDTGAIVRYCAIPMGRAICYGGEPLPEEREKLTRRAVSGLEAIKALLKNKNFEHHPAIVSMPRDLRIMHGEADLLIYDKQNDVFHANLIVPENEAAITSERLNQ